jgi:ketosteroid isomerase-like protein
MAETDTNKEVALQFLDRIWTWDPEQYGPLLTDNPVYQGGVNVREGREGFAETARYGRLLYPNGKDRLTVHRIIAEGDSVAAHITVEAVTNADKEYKNDYVLMFTFEDGRISKLVEMLDFRVSTDKFDLSVLA